MANSQDVDLMGVGKHCSLDFCRRLDMLPFVCQKCHQVFCSEHRKRVDHHCPVQDEDDAHVPICPLCNQLVIKNKHEDVNDQMERHIISGCKDLLVRKKPVHRCAERRCKAIQPIPFVCTKCGKQYCVRHRHYSDHSCVKMVEGVA
ncbi:AN1-type zinc finger protein 2A-like [Corticium candelabrum]|uniref:AN1-type zinc finger protein 2A-like n=1 Tax=Corticium candelabrum TaxID=121492 RepID=UPI002E26CAD3|nr:AN1-type zinc finger protein 2A-like [Corticium candelabrum]